MRRRGPLLAAAGVVLAAALAASAVPAPSQAAATAWLSGYLDAAFAGDARRAAYLDLRVDYDDRALSHDHVVGRFASVNAVRDTAGTRGAATVDATYLDVTGAAALQTVAPVDRGVCETETPLLRVLDVGPDGVQAEVLLPAVLTSSNACAAGVTGRLDLDVGARAALDVADRWVQQAGRRGVAVGLDRLTGHHDLPEVRAVLAGSAAARAVADLPAVYLGRVAPLSSRLDQVWLAVHLDGMPVLVGLTLGEDGGVVERRRLADPRGLDPCGPAERCDRPWWLGRELPVPPAERSTGPVPLAEGSVQVANGSPALTDDLRWAVGRFALAGLHAPRVASVTFDPYDPLCVRDDGRATFTPDGARVLVCLEDGVPCRRFGCDVGAYRRLLLLHELGHAWVHDHVPVATRAQLLVLVGASRWSDDDGDPRRLGVEWAADTLAWGLHGDPDAALRVGPAPCATLTTGFVLLTGASPVTVCPPS